jgi:hypothetical protein
MKRPANWKAVPHAFEKGNAQIGPFWTEKARARQDSFYAQRQAALLGHALRLPVLCLCLELGRTAGKSHSNEWYVSAYGVSLEMMATTEWLARHPAAPGAGFTQITQTQRDARQQV